jgi:phage repressor protein C with HTH and peptisase S24 domain
MRLNDVRGRLKNMRRSQADLARHLELDPSSLVKVLAGSRRVTPVEVLKIEQYFGEALEVEGVGPVGARKARASSRVPVYGYAAAGGDDRIAFAEDRVLDYIDPPPWWNGAGELIYVRLVGESMEPRYFSGEILPVRLNVPPAKNQDCLILFNDATAIVKTFTGRRDGKVWALQYNERKEVHFEASSIQALHAVWKPGMF